MVKGVTLKQYIHKHFKGDLQFFADLYNLPLETIQRWQYFDAAIIDEKYLKKLRN